ncbi:MAG: hypothetical protein ABIV47_09960 [Roseiflexaceae bacterium]
MCKRKSYLSDRPMMATEGAYEGQTVRLDARDSVSHERRDHHSCGHHGGFRWWTLWLIWPLIGLVKWFVPLYLAAITASLAQLSMVGAAPLVGLALIVIGLVLIRRRSYRD